MESNEGRAQRLLSELGRKIDELSLKIKDKAKEKGVDLDAEVEKLKRERERLEEEVRDFRDKNEPRFRNMVDHLEKACQELGRAAEALFKKYN
jgi:cell division protein FtsB